MKNIVFVLVILAANVSSAQTKVEAQFSGRLFGLFQWYQLPTSQKDEMEFMAPRLELSTGLTSGEHIAVGFRVDAGKARNPSNGEQTVQLKEAFLQWNQNAWSFQWGLIPDYFLASQKKQFDFYYLSSMADSLAERFSYISEADQGIALTGKFESAVFSISLRNGEGLAATEQGFRKDLSAYFEYNFDQFSLISNAVAGGYDGLSPEASRKYRGTLGISWHPNRSVYLQYLYFMFNDPVDSFPTFKQADGVDLAGFGGEMALGVGHQLRGVLIKDFAEKGSKYLFFDAKSLKPKKAVQATLWSIFLGFGYDIEKNLQVDLSLGTLHYSENYSLSVEDQGQVGVGFNFSF